MGKQPKKISNEWDLTEVYDSLKSEYNTKKNIAPKSIGDNDLSDVEQRLKNQTNTRTKDEALQQDTSTIIPEIVQEQKVGPQIVESKKPYTPIRPIDAFGIVPPEQKSESTISSMMGTPDPNVLNQSLEKVAPEFVKNQKEKSQKEYDAYVKAKEEKINNRVKAIKESGIDQKKIDALPKDVMDFYVNHAAEFGEDTFQKPKQQKYSQVPSGILGVQDFFTVQVPKAVDGFLGILNGLGFKGKLTQENYVAREKLREAWTTNEKNREEFKTQNDQWYQFGLGLSSIVPAYLSGGSVALAGGGKIAALFSTLSSTAVLEGGLAYNEALQYTGNPQEATNTGLLVAMINAPLETLPVARMFDKFGIDDKVKGEITRQVIKKKLWQTVPIAMVEQGKFEAVTESLQEVMPLIRESLYKEAKDKPTFNDWFNRIGESYIYGMLIGALAGGGGQIYSDARANQYYKKLEKELIEKEGKTLSYQDVDQIVRNELNPNVDQQLSTTQETRKDVREDDKTGNVFDQLVRDTQSPTKVKTQPKDYFKMTEQEQKLEPPVIEKKPEFNINPVENAPVEGVTVEQSPVTNALDQVKLEQENQNRIKTIQQDKRNQKVDTDRFAELNRQVKNTRRKRTLADTDLIKQNIEQTNIPEIKQKMLDLLNETEKYNEKLANGNKLTVENLSQKKYGKIPNELTEEQQRAVLDEYNEMKKQGLTEFRNIQPFKKVQDQVSNIPEVQQQVAPVTTPQAKKEPTFKDGRAFAIKLKDGTVISDPYATNHLDVMENKGLSNIDDFAEAGWIEKDGTFFKDVSSELQDNIDIRNEPEATDEQKPAKIETKQEDLSTAPESATKKFSSPEDYFKVDKSIDLTKYVKEKIGEKELNKLMLDAFNDPENLTPTEGKTVEDMQAAKIESAIGAKAQELMDINRKEDVKPEVKVKEPSLREMVSEDKQLEQLTQRAADSKTKDAYLSSLTKEEKSLIESTGVSPKEFYDIRFEKKATGFVAKQPTPEVKGKQLFEMSQEEANDNQKISNIIRQQKTSQSKYTAELAKNHLDVKSFEKRLKNEFGFEREINLGDFSKVTDIRDLVKESGFKIVDERELQTGTFNGGNATEIIADHPQRGRKYIYELPERVDIDSFNNNILVTTKPLTEKQYAELLYQATGRKNSLQEQPYEDLFETLSGDKVKVTDRDAGMATIVYKDGHEEKIPLGEIKPVETLPQIKDRALREARGGNFADVPDSRDVHSIYQMLDPNNPIGTNKKISEILFRITDKNTTEIKREFLEAISDRIKNTFKDSETTAEINNIVNSNIGRYSEWFDTMRPDIIQAVKKIKSHPDYPELSKPDNNKAAIKRMIGENKTFYQISETLKIPIDEVIENSGLPIGKNKDGEFLFEDGKGVRYKLEGEKRNIKVGEEVGIIPGSKSISLDRTKEEWLTKEELKAQEKEKAEIKDEEPTIIRQSLVTGEVDEIKPQSKEKETPSVIDDEMRDIIKDIGKDLGITFQLKKPDYKNDIGIKTIQKKQIESPEFKKWFGGSKVVDEKGEPLVVYHISRNKFNEFRGEENLGNKATVLGANYFLDNKKDLQNFGDFDEDNIYEVYLNIKKPLRINIRDTAWTSLEFQQLLAEARAGIDNELTEYLRDEKLDDNVDKYDGIILSNPGYTSNAGKEYIVFKPTQIKSATGNTGTFDKNNPDIRYQLKPGQKIPAETQTKAITLIDKFIGKEIYQFDNIVLAVEQAFGRKTLEEILPALKAGYTGYLSNASDLETEKMDSFDYVKRFRLKATKEETDAVKKIFEEGVPDKTPDEANKLVSRPYIQRVREEIRKGNVLTKTQLEKIAKEFGITDPNVAKEQAELAIVVEARKIINDTKDENDTYDKLVQLYNNQPNLTHRTNETVEKQQYSTPAPVAYIAGLYVSDEVKAGDVLEPSAGNGMLTIAFNPNQVFANEIDEVRLRNLRQSGLQSISEKDAEKNDNLFNKKFDGIMTNPPFGGAEEKLFDGYKLSKLEHIMAANALNQMKDDGRAGIIIGGHNRYDNKGRLQNDRFFFNWLYHHYNVDAVLNVSGDLYKKQGAGFPIRVILVNGRKATPAGASPLNNPAENLEIKDFQDLYDRIERIRNGNILRPEADADRGPIRTSNVQGSKGESLQNPEGIKTISERPDSGINQEKPRGDGENTNLGVRPSGTGKSLHGESGRPGGDNTTKPTISDSSRESGDGTTGGIIEGGSGGDVQQGFDREPIIPIKGANLELDKPKVPYIAESKGVSLDTVIPRNMAYDTAKTLRKLAESVGGDIDLYVANKLGYGNKEELFSRLGAEQIDATAMAIVAIEKGQGMIIGDMTGVGKGRIAGAVIRYAVINGYKPIFFTETPDLYSDLYRDFKNIDSYDLLPFIINENTKIVDEDGVVLHQSISGKDKVKILRSGDLKKYDLVVATYSQVRDEKRAIKRDFISDLANNNILVMDESHNASGNSNTGVYFKDIIQKSKGVTYLSATFAKRPDNMPIYALKTAISEANLSEDELINAIEKGGVALQEILATDMVEAGQMIRREKTYEGIKIDYKPLVELKEEHSKIADTVTEIIRDIITFQNQHVKEIVTSLDTEAAVNGETVNIESGTNQAGVDNTPFASKVFNIIDQLLFSIKAESAAKETMAVFKPDAEFKKGRKPVIAIKNTMESFLDYLNVQDGEIIDNTDFSTVLERGLRGVMKITTKDAMGNKTPGELSINDLTPSGRAAYKALIAKIEKTSTGITISPIDKMVYDLNKAGYKVGEVTGRKIMLKYRDDGKAIVMKRSERDKKKLFREFNNWENPGEPRGVDGYTDMALMINASGATGRSAHSGPKFKDQRPRVTVTTQLELNINTEVQKRGRTNRTGQVNKPSYLTLSSAIPAEQRLMMMAKKKLKSLDANVSSDQSQSEGALEVNDFLNKYGDTVVVEYLKENRDINDMLLDPLKMNEKTDEDLEKFRTDEHAAHKVSGRVAFLPTKLQEEFYTEIGQRYDDLIKYLDSVGENDLEVKTMPLEAKTLSSKTLVAGKGGNSPFGRDTMLESVEVNVLKKPYKMEKVNELLKNYLDGKEGGAKKKAIQEDFKTFWGEWTVDHLDKKRETIAKRLEISKDDVDKIVRGISQEKVKELFPHLAKNYAEVEKAELEYTILENKMMDQGTFVVNNIIGRFNVGRVYKVPLVRDTTAPIYSNGVFLGWGITPKRKNPYAPSAITMKFAVADSRQLITIPASQRDWLNDLTSESSSLTGWQEKDILEGWDSSLPDSRREVQNIVTGNILQAVGDVKGQLISYTTKEGGIKRGILVRDNKSLQAFEMRVPIKRAKTIIGNLEVNDYVETSSGEVIITNDGGNRWTIEVPASKQKGGKFYLDEGIRAIVKDGRFDKRGNKMIAYFGKQDLSKLIDVLQNDFSQSLRLSQDQLKDVDGGDISYQLKPVKSYNDDFGNKIPAKFSAIHEYKLGHPLLKDVDIETIPFKVVYWTREEIKSYDYTDEFVDTLEKLEKGDFGYEPGKEKYAVEIKEVTIPSTKGGRTRIIVSITATTSAYTEGIIHTIYSKLEKENPDLLRRINIWEEIVREAGKEYGIGIPEGSETFVQAMTFTHLGYASENPDVAEIYEIPKDILDEFTKILDMGEISSDVLKGGEIKPETKLNAESLEKFRQKRGGKESIPSIDPKLIKAQELFDKLKSEKGQTTDIYLDWVKGMRSQYGKDFDREARLIWRQMKDASYQLKPAPSELINKVQSKGLEIDKNLIATHKIKGEAKDYITVSTPDRTITKMIEVDKLDQDLKLFNQKKSDLLSAREILGNNQGRFPTPSAIKEAKELLKEKFLDDYYKFRDKKISGDDYEDVDRIAEEGNLFESFSRRVVAANKMGVKNINSDLWEKANQFDKVETPQYQLKKPRKTKEQRLHGYKFETELAREQGREPESGEGNIVDFGVGLGQVFTVTADKIKDYVRNNQLEKEFGIETDSKARYYYRQFLTAPQWYFDKEPQLKRFWDIMDRYFVRNVNEETAILKEDKWKNSKPWKGLSAIHQKEFLSALEEYEQTQYELQRDEGKAELLSWADFADEFAFTPEVSDFLFRVYKPTIEAALDMVKDVDRYRIINETETNPYLEEYFIGAKKKLTTDKLELLLDAAKQEFFTDSPNAEFLYENELLKMGNKVDEVKALQLAWINNQDLRTVLADVLVDKKYQPIDDKAYFPSSRLEKKYFLSAMKKSTPKEKLLEGKFDDRFFTTSDSLDKLKKIKEELEAQGYTIRPGKDIGLFAEAQEEILMNAITKEDMLDLALSAGIDQDNPILEKLVKTIQAKGFSRHFIPKRFIPGYEYTVPNFEESIFKYITSVPFYKNRTIGGKEYAKTMASLKKSGVLKTGSANDTYIHDLKTKLENRDINLSQGLRAVASTYYLALSPAYLSQQIVQPINTLLPYLPIVAKELGLKSIEAEKAFGESLFSSIQYWSWKMVDKINRLQGRQTRATFGLDREFLSVIRSLERQGVGKPLRSMELAGQEVDPRKHYNRDIVSKTTDVLGWIAKVAGAPGIMIEDFTRTIGIRTFYNLAKKAGLKGDKLEDFISVNIAKSYGPASGRLAKPPGYYIAGEGRMKPAKTFAQSVIESWLTFKNFAFMNYGQWGKIWRALRNDNIYRSVGYKAGSQIALGGLKYIMWSASILSLMSLIYDMLDIPEDPEEQYESMFKQFNKLVPGLGDALYKGVASVTFKVDLSSLFAQTAPIEEPFTKDAIQLIGGAPASAVQDIIGGKAPRVARGYQVADKWEEEGVKFGSRKLIAKEEITEEDKTKRKLGYTPLKISDAYQQENSRQFKSGQYTDIIRDKVSDVIIPLIQSGKSSNARDEFRKLWEEMKADNILTEHQKKSISGVNNFISQVVLSRLKESERAIIKDWKNGTTISRTRKDDRGEDRERRETR